jgi:hypothetical protein
MGFNSAFKGLITTAAETQLKYDTLNTGDLTGPVLQLLKTQIYGQKSDDATKLKLPLLYFQ